MSERVYAITAPIEMVDVRENDAQGTWTMSGYAAVFGQKAEVYADKFVRATTELSPEAFSNVLKTQSFAEPSGVVHFNRGHEMNSAVAATDVPAGQPGSLKLSVDKNGLHFMAKVSKADPDAVALAEKMRVGVVRQASFAFTTSGNEFSYAENEDGPDEENRLITDIQHLYDVCACPQGVFSQTVSSLERYATLLGQPEGFAPTGDQRHQPDLGEGSADSPEEAGVVAEEAPPLEWPDLTEQMSRNRPIAVDRPER